MIILYTHLKLLYFLKQSKISNELNFNDLTNLGAFLLKRESSLKKKINKKILGHIFFILGALGNDLSHLVQGQPVSDELESLIIKKKKK